MQGAVERLIIGCERYGHRMSETGGQRLQGPAQHPAAQGEQGQDRVIVALARNGTFTAVKFELDPAATVTRLQRNGYGIADQTQIANQARESCLQVGARHHGIADDPVLIRPGHMRIG